MPLSSLLDVKIEGDINCKVQAVLNIEKDCFQPQSKEPQKSKDSRRITRARKKYFVDAKLNLVDT